MARRSNDNNKKISIEVLVGVLVVSVILLIGNFSDSALINRLLEELEINGHKYTQGGLDYLSKYINILRNEFPERLLYLDAGDLFQGGTESTFSNGEIMTESLNLMKCQASTFGDHEYDYSREFLEDKILTYEYFEAKIQSANDFNKTMDYIIEGGLKKIENKLKNQDLVIKTDSESKSNCVVF